jgi:hypothetical protein
MTVFGKTCTDVFGTSLVYLEHGWCIWNMVGVFGNCLMYLEHDWCIWNMVGVFGN